MKAAVSWVVAPCSLVDVHRRFGGAGYLCHHGEADCMVHIPEDCHFISLVH
jgi:hypothetical protein